MTDRARRVLAALVLAVCAAPAAGQVPALLPEIPAAPVAPTTAPAPAPEADPAKAPAAPAPAPPKGLTDSVHQSDDYGLKSLFDSLHPRDRTGKKWYEKLSLRGYTQFRFARTVDQDPGADPNALGDRSINGTAENFSIRRMRLIIFGDVSEHLGIYIQPDFASSPQGATTTTFFGQLRDAYADAYFDTTKIHRLRIGLSKVPFGWENLQSSQNRMPLDRTDALNTAVSPNERDLGVFYYWTPEDQQKLLRELVDGGLKGSGNYGIFGVGVYNGQGGSQFEQNLNLHTVARVTWPVRLDSGQVVEASVQGYTGEYVVQGAAIRPLGRGNGITPAGTGGNQGHRDQRVAATFVYYPQPFGFQAEWNYGEGPGLDDSQAFVTTRPLHGGYAMVSYKFDTCDYGILSPYCRWQYYKGGYRAAANAPYGSHDQWDIGLEWQIRREMELVTEYSIVDGVNLNAINQAGVTPYRNFSGGVFRVQFQVNY